jgi:hypothetical protein
MLMIILWRLSVAQPESNTINAKEMQAMLLGIFDGDNLRPARRIVQKIRSLKDILPPQNLKMNFSRGAASRLIPLAGLLILSDAGVRERLLK